MSMPSSSEAHPIAAFVKRHDLLRAIVEWIAERLAEADEGDTSIAWEDGEEHDEDGPKVA
jgi:hypothetical protein